MHRILFVCHGNICRSTMAEFVLKDLVERRGVADEFLIESAATSTDEIGNDTDPRTARVLDAHGVAHPRRQARQVVAADADDYDLIIGMDQSNMRDLKRMLPGAEDKLAKLLSFAGVDADVADPWYTHDFGTTFEDVNRGCEALLEHLGY